MNNPISKSALATAIAMTVVACGGSGGGVAGIGGSGFISSGSISNFGSVFVNGVEFETDTATFDIEGSSGTQSDLDIGMVVQVSGTINSDGVTGTATHISFDDQLQGPVSGLTAITADGMRSCMILGVKVIIDSVSTSFDVSGDLPAGTVFDIDTMVNNNNVEVSGFLDSAGNLVATRIELKDIVFDANSIVETRGKISGLMNTMFMLGDLNVDAASAMLEDMPDGMQEGMLVEVKGTYDTASNTINATVVEAEDDVIEDTDEIEIEGIITSYVDNSNFEINGIPVDASGAVFEPASLMLTNDVRIEVEGAIIDGVLVADEVEGKDGELEVHAAVSAVDAVAGTFVLEPVLGSSITVMVSSSTKMEDKVNDIESLTLDNLAINDFVEVRGFDDGAGGISATEVRIRETDNVIVQGVIEDGVDGGGTITVFGVDFVIDGATEFADVNEALISQADFFIAAPLGMTLVKVEDSAPADGIADKVEIEQ